MQTRRRKRRADQKEQEVPPQTETVVHDRTITERETITRSIAPAQPAPHIPESAQPAAQNNISHQSLISENAPTVAPEDQRQQSVASETAGQNGNDDDPMTVVNEVGDGWEDDDSASDYAKDTSSKKLAEQRTQKGTLRKRPFKPRPSRRTYTEQDDKDMLEWVEWVRNETKYPVWSSGHWEMLSQKVRASSTTFECIC